jgi:hypothetical protein
MRRSPPISRHRLHCTSLSREAHVQLVALIVRDCVLMRRQGVAIERRFCVMSVAIALAGHRWSCAASRGTSGPSDVHRLRARHARGLMIVDRWRPVWLGWGQARWGAREAPSGQLSRRLPVSSRVCDGAPPPARSACSFVGVAPAALRRPRCERDRVRAVAGRTRPYPRGSVRVRRESRSDRSDVARWLASCAAGSGRAVGERHPGVAPKSARVGRARRYGSGRRRGGLW